MNLSTRSDHTPSGRHVLIGTAVAFALLHGGTASATTECFDFSGPPVGTVHEVGGAPLYTDFATIRVQPFSVDGQPLPPEDGRTTIVQSNLPSGTPPSLQVTSATVQVWLDTPASKVTFDYAQNTGLGDLQRQNLGANGERRTDLVGGLVGGLEQLSGEELGLASYGGPVGIAINAAPDDFVPPTWVRGTVTMWALDQGIDVFSFGGHGNVHVDNVCATS